MPGKDWRDPVTGLTLEEMESRLRARRDALMKQKLSEPPPLRAWTTRDAREELLEEMRKALKEFGGF